MSEFDDIPTPILKEQVERQIRTIEANLAKVDAVRAELRRRGFSEEEIASQLWGRHEASSND